MGGRVMADAVFVVLTVLLFSILTVVVRAVEKL